jgi:uncharacterized protein YkwD
MPDLRRESTVGGGVAGAALLLMALGGLTSSCGPAAPPPGATNSDCDPTSFDLTTELTSGPAEAILQLNCYRRRMDANIAVLEASLNEAAQLHADYLSATGAWGHAENDTSQPSYRGDSPGERAEAAGYPIDDNLQSISELIGFRESGADASQAVDLWFNTVYHRLPLAIPELEAVGFGSAGIYDVMLVVSPWEAPFEAPDFLSNVYPVPGQRGVPLAFDSDREIPDPVPDGGEVGFPVSLSFLDQSFFEPSDLYDLQVDTENSGLRDAAGDRVPALLLRPADDELVRRSVVFIPTEVLQAQSYYSAVITGEVGGTAFAQSWSFETGP